MASTFTGLKLQGLLGSFGKTTVTDIEGYVELPDGKVFFSAHFTFCIFTHKYLQIFK